jgi:predicted phosphohydrolase
VCISDTHNNLGKVSVPPGDILLHAGDLTGGGSLHEITRFASDLAGLPHERKVIIAGNHDFLFQVEPAAAKKALLQAGPGTIYLQDDATVLFGLKIYGSPWQPWFHDWAFNLPRGAERKKKWDLIPDDTDILMTHGPPHGIGDRTAGGELAGCEELRRAVRERVRPRYHVFGHIHEGYGRQHDPEFDIDYINASICTLRYQPTNAPIVFEMTARG